MSDSNSRRPMVRIPSISTVDQTRRRKSLEQGASPIRLTSIGQRQLLKIDDWGYERWSRAESSDDSVARIGPARGTDLPSTRVVIALAHGSCQILISDHRGPQGSISVIVGRRDDDTP